MGFASESGYTPQTIDDLMDLVRAGVNTQFSTAYTTETFIGTNFYKFYYALIQLLQQNEVKTSEIFAKLQGYLTLTNERISRPVVTNPGLIEKLEGEGYVASIKGPIDADAGKVFVCVDTNSAAPTYAATKLAINTILSQSTAAGTVTQGTEVSAITLSNGQTFNFKFKLPNYLTALLRLTVTLSENNQVVIQTPELQKLKLMTNIAARYRLGRNFEPQTYFTTADAPWAQSVLLEWSTNGGTTWQSTVYDAAYDDLFVVSLANITLVEV